MPQAILNHNATQAEKVDNSIAALVPQGLKNNELARILAQLNTW
jgi:hypothetical protein